jgi:ATP-dependent helicase/nuclease subunit A
MAAVMILNELISASAGTGKTYRLTTRFLFWLLHGGDPARAIALTFSKKAAGEFLDRILTRLGEAATDPKAFDKLAKDFAAYTAPDGAPPVTQAGCLEALERLVSQIHAIRLGTLDSFYHMVLSTFGYEFGLPGGFEMLDDLGQSNAIQQTLSQLAAETPGLLDDFITANEGKAPKNVGKTLEEWANRYARIWRQAPDLSLWGTSHAIWGSPEPPFTLLDDRRLRQNQGTIEQACEDPGQLDGKGNTVKGLRSALKNFREWLPGKSPDLGNLAANALANLEIFKAGKGTLPWGKSEYTLPPEVSRAVGELLEDRLRRELDVLLPRTAGLARILHQYEDLYNRNVRGKGLLTFEDFPVLLDPTTPDTHTLSLRKPDEVSRLQMDFRFDGQFDQWYLDEFQDTSNPQWRVLKNLAEEAMSDDQQKALFLVGDPKQAIYGWRGGDHTLFHRIEKDYWEPGLNAPHLFRKGHLVESYRSCGPVLELVNEVFGQQDLQEEFDTTAAAEWAHAWSEHISAGAKKDKCGFAQVLVAPKAQGEEDDPALKATLGLLNEIRPWEKGLRTAIIVRKNKQIQDTITYLRANGPEGLRVTGDASYSAGFDNPLATYLMSLLKATAHPLDTFAQRHLSMGALADELCFEKKGKPRLRNEVRANLLGLIQAEGFEAALEPWVRKLLAKLGTKDAFTESRADELLDICREFDATHQRDIDAFLDFAAAYQSREPNSGGSIKVMTIHRSKGLTFDLSIVHGINGHQALATPNRESPFIQYCQDGRPKWAFHIPSEAIARAIPEFRQPFEELKTQSCYETFCNLYVALTRAKYGSYVILERPGPGTQNVSKFLHMALHPEEAEYLGNRKKDDPPTTLETVADWEKTGVAHQPEAWKQETFVLWSSTSPKASQAWHSQTNRQEEREKSQDSPPALCPAVNPTLGLRTHNPSEHAQALKGEWLFPVAKQPSAADFGTAVHALFEDIEWLPVDFAPENFHLPTPNAAAKDHVRECLSHPEPRALLTRPATPVEVWREKRFFHILENDSGEPDSYCSGIIDRVVLHKDMAGDLQAAEIIDFKTDRLGEEELDEAIRRHGEQLRLYRQILSSLLRIPEAKVSCKLLMTHSNRVVVV